MIGCIERHLGLNPGYRIKVDSLDTINYLGMSKRAAIRRYRREFNLGRARIYWTEWTTRN